ncbi:MAG: NAD-dependent epimerase/dehydratase family protein [Spirochaetes bacterium]|jgi:nucleoside-diphosphate-sugar epimerase|nr:NAD-dependent epimerase/dehydratase family protein [Spirochaetota bacterium]
MNTHKDTKGVHLVIGSGPVGLAVANRLAALGKQTVLASRSATKYAIAGVVSECADATDTDQLRSLAGDASVIYHCANAPYHQWPGKLPPIWNGILAAAQENGVRLVIASNLYAYGIPSAPLTGHESFAPCSRKGHVRATLEAATLAAHERGDVSVAIVRGSDFYGPGVRESVMGDRFFGALLSGKSPVMFGLATAPHSYTYVPDFARTMVAIGSDDDTGTYGRSWIVPSAAAVTQQEIESTLRSIGYACSIKSMGKGMVRFGGLFVPAARETVEMMYEFDRPFTVDSSETEKRFGIVPTPLRDGLEQTVQAFANQKGEQAAHGKRASGTHTTHATHAGRAKGPDPGQAD